MSMNSETLSKDPSAQQQRRQANMFLVRLQWVVILLLIAALLWLYISQQRFQHNVNEHLQGNEQVVSRLNEMDDRLFAMSQQTLPAPSTAATNSQAQNQLDLLRIQIQAADRLLADNNDSAAIELLRGLHWQLSQSSNEIAPALTVLIKQSLMKDIESLQARSSQPSPWQLQNLAIQNIQDFLHSHERATHANLNATTQQKSAATINLPASKPTANMNLTRRQLTIHEVIMTLNLASQASNMREREQLVVYLSQARKQLQTLVTKTPTSKDSLPKISGPKASGPKAATNTKDAPSTNDLQTKSSPTDILEVIQWLDQLIANAPKATSLLTSQILNKAQR